MSVKLQATVDKYKVQNNTDLFFCIPTVLDNSASFKFKKDLNEVNYTLYLKAGSVLIGEF